MRGLESLELVIAMSIFLAFIIGFMYIFNWFGLYKQQEALQVDLSAVAQQALDRILHTRPFDPSKSLGLGGDGRFIDDNLVYYYATATNASGKLCKIESKALRDHLGVDEAYWAGRGWLILKGKSATLNFSSILANLFGVASLWGADTRPSLQLYDIRLVVTPAASATCRVDKDKATLSIQPRGKADGRVVYSIYYVPEGSKKLCYTTGVRSTINGVLTLDLKSLMYMCEDGSIGNSYESGTVVAIFEKIDKPALICFNSSSTSSRPFVYGFAAMRGGSMSLYVVHDSAIACGEGNLAALGVRHIDLFWGGTRVRVAQDVILDPGIGKGAVKVDSCGKCSENARCTACYVDNVPEGTKVAVVVVDTSARGNLDVVVVPLVPHPPIKSVDIATWVRWGLINEPRVFTTAATRVVDSHSTTYNVTLWVYRWP